MNMLKAKVLQLTTQDHKRLSANTFVMVIKLR